MKAGKLLLMALVIIAATPLATLAVTIQTPWQTGQPEENLYQIVTAWGFPVSNEALQTTTPLEGLPAGTYLIDHYAVYASMPQLLGTYPLDQTPPAHNQRIHGGGINMSKMKHSGKGAGDIIFSRTSAFGFFDSADHKTYLITTQNQNSGDAPYYQASGLIFDLAKINPQYVGQYIIAFNDGSKSNPYGDLDYNDLVVHLHYLNQGGRGTTPVPLPGALPLMAGGLLGLWLLGRYGRLFFSKSALSGH